VLEDAELVDALLPSVDAFCARHVAARAIDAAARIDRRLLDGLAELGLFGLSIPTSHGGFGLPLVDICEVIAGLARHDRALATSVGLHLGLGTRGLVAFGSDALRDEWLPGLAAGARMAAFATTEAGAGSDLGAIRTRAALTGGRLRLDGEKIFVTNGGFADVFTVTAATPDFGGRNRHSLVLLTRGDGLRSGAEEHKLGLRGSSTTTLHLDGVHVGVDRIVGVPGEGMGQLAHVLAWGRTVMAAGCCGTARAALDATLEHVAHRRQFARTLLSMDVVRTQLATMRARAFAARAMVRQAASALDDETLAALSTSAKVFASEAAWSITDDALQLHGGVGYVEETGIALLLRDARITRIFEGANDVLRVHRGVVEATRPVSRTVLLLGRGEGPPQRPPDPSGPPADSHALAFPTLLAEAEAFHVEVRGLRDALAKRWGARLLARPALLHALGEAAILRDVTDAVVSAVRTDTDAALAELWIAEARTRFASLSRSPADPRLLDRALQEGAA
jgi:alkylation response protein AidB-like acyl-CoA dehydrogenase